jgi:hypothetical protein
MRENRDAFSRGATIVAGATQVLNLCYLPVFALVLSIDGSTWASSDQHIAHLPERKRASCLTLEVVIAIIERARDRASCCPKRRRLLTKLYAARGEIHRDEVRLRNYPYRRQNYLSKFTSRILRGNCNLERTEINFEIYLTVIPPQQALETVITNKT